MQPISGINHVQPVEGIGGSSRTAPSGDFAGVLQSAIRSVEGGQSAAAKTIEQFLSGDGVDLHTAAIATQKANLQLEMFLQARNKVVQAYQEVMRMQL